MTNKLFVVYDSKAEAYMVPFFMMTTGQAVRAWSDTVNDPNSMFAKHPGDFTLFEIGEYDDQNGYVTMLEHKKNLGTALEHIKQNLPQIQPVQLSEVRQ